METEGAERKYGAWSLKLIEEFIEVWSECKP